MNDLRVAWLLPTAWFYWQPSLSELSKLFPNTKVFSGLFPGFAKGFENSIDIEVVGVRKVIPLIPSKNSYGDNFTYLSPKIIPRLFQYHPNIVFSSSFGVWSILALLFKFLGRWRVVIAYEGSSPGVDYRDSRFRSALRKLMVYFADACITNSYAGKKYLTEILKAPIEKVFVQPYEVPDARSLVEVNQNLLYPTPNHRTRFENLQHPLFLFVGSIVPRKGVKCLIEACKYLKELDSQPFSILLVGDGKQRSELQTLSQKYNLDNHIIWVGRVDYHDISTYFYHADVFLFPTLEDTWGMVVLEAMLLGKPILCSRGAGASELITEDKNGYCFRPNDSKQLASIMQKFIKNPEKAKVMGQFSKQIINQYTSQAAAEMMSKVITYVMAN